MIPFVTDEDFDGRIVRGLLRHMSDIDLVRSQDMGLLGGSDEKLLEWATDNARLLLTHDKRTMPRHVRDRLAAGLTVPGVFIVNDMSPIGLCIEEIELIATCSNAEEWQNQVVYLPFA